MRAETLITKRPDFLMSSLVCVSILIHFFIYLHISGIYRSNALQYIELALANVSSPVDRAIPRPPPRPKMLDQPLDAEPIVAKPSVVPRVQPIRMEPAGGNFPEGVMEQIDTPDIDAAARAGGEIYALDAVPTGGAAYATGKNYLEMIVLKIEANKRFPEAAKSMRQEGRVAVAFTVTLAGQVRDIHIEKPCRHELLNQAAVQAVRNAAPFPRPPVKFFQNDIPLKLHIIFEIT